MSKIKVNCDNCGKEFEIERKFIMPEKEKAIIIIVQNYVNHNHEKQA